MDIVRIETPLIDKIIKELKVGMQVLLSGIVYTARDIAHQKLVDLALHNKPFPFDPKGSVIYYVGPTPAKPGYIIGSAGPTTSCRMDSFTPILLDMGIKGMIGKGPRSKEVVESIQKNVAIYFGATGGAGALISKSIIESEVIAFEELGTEAIRKLRVKDMPLIVINDCYGNDLYIEGQKKWQRKKI